MRDSAAPNSDEIGVKVAGMEQVQAQWFVPGSGGVLVAAVTKSATLLQAR